MPFYGIHVDARGRHQVFRTVNGIYRLDVGPAFTKPRDAIAYAAALEEMPSVSPLRPTSREAARTLPASPLLGSPDERRQAPVGG